MRYFKKAKVVVILAEGLIGRGDAESERGASDLHGKGFNLWCLMLNVLDYSVLILFSF